MLITVVYENGKYGLVDNSELDELIEKRKIKKFLRSTGWCQIGIDPMRKESRCDYRGPERRKINKNASNRVELEI